jgi:hypothetical protein
MTFFKNTEMMAERGDSAYVFGESQCLRPEHPQFEDKYRKNA